MPSAPTTWSKCVGRVTVHMLRARQGRAEQVQPRLGLDRSILKGVKKDRLKLESLRVRQVKGSGCVKIANLFPPTSAESPLPGLLGV